jgi:hypothetical protein
MDPQAALIELLGLFETPQHGQGFDRVRAVELLSGLAVWLGNGGFPPWSVPVNYYRNSWIIPEKDTRERERGTRDTPALPPSPELDAAIELRMKRIEDAKKRRDSLLRGEGSDN